MKKLKVKTQNQAKFIPLTQGQFAIVDADDYERLAVHKWYLGGWKRKYAQRSSDGKTIMMHREIIEVPAGMVCDHINHNTLDNRKCNLRSCTLAQNGYNRLPNKNSSSRYKGVCLNKKRRKWAANIRYQNRLIHISYFDEEEEAAIAYDDMAIKLFGEFACLNCQYRPEIRQWIEQMYLFPPMEVDPDCINQSNPYQEKSYISL